MHQIIDPEFYIHLGIKDNKVVSVDWSELIVLIQPKTTKEIKKKMNDYLKQSLKIVNNIGKKKNDII